MKMVKSLLLGTAAGFVAFAGAQAADLPGKAAPATYVKVCDTYGAGYYYIPGSNTCLSISGAVAAAFTYGVGTANQTASTALQNSFVYANIVLDARTQTEYGLLRSVIGFQGQRGSSPWSAGASNGSTSGAISSVYPTATSWFALTNAFIQLGGFTAGYAPSFYNAAPAGWSSLDFGTPGPNNRNTLQMAYTASFGGGFLASIAIEDPRYRRTNPTAGFDVGVNVSSTGVLSAAGAAMPGVTTYAGTVLPNLVAALRVEQGWGSAQISGALQELRAYNTVATTTTGSLNDVSTGMGFAIGGGLTVKLDSLAKGDYIALSANYTNGATGYLFNRTPRDGGILASTTLPVGFATASIEDFRFGGGAIQTVTGFSVFGSFRHYFTPAVYGTLFGDYISTSAPAAYTGNIFQHLLVGANVAYMPVKGFTIGLEGSYQTLNATNSAGAYAGAGQAYDSVLTGMLFAKREF